jgi:hypothetical protein
MGSMWPGEMVSWQCQWAVRENPLEKMPLVLHRFVCDLLLRLVFFCGAGDGMQALAHAMQALYHYMPNPSGCVRESKTVP